MCNACKTLLRSGCHKAAVLPLDELGKLMHCDDVYFTERLLALKAATLGAELSLIGSYSEGVQKPTCRLKDGD